jgi:hypothetical protein
MPTYQIKHASMYANGAKIATAVTSQVSIKSGDEQLFADDGAVGYSDGAITTTCAIDEIVPVPGTTFDFVGAMKSKAYIDMQFALLDGAIWDVSMRCLDRDYSSDAKTGMLTSKANLGGGEPDITDGP